MARINPKVSRPPAGGSSFSPDNLPVYRGGSSASAWTPAELFTGGEVGDWWDFRDATGLYQDTGGTTPVASPGDSIARAEGREGSITLTQGTGSLQPIWDSAMEHNLGVGTDYLGKTTLSIGYTSGITLFAKAAIPAATSTFSLIETFRTTTPGDKIYHQSTTFRYKFKAGSVKSITGTADNSYYTYMLLSNSGGTAADGYKDNVSQGAVPVGAATLIDELRVGARDNGTLPSKTTFTLFIDRPLTGDEITELEAYVA